MKAPIREFAPPFFVYLAFFLSTLAIGSERSCDGGQEFYILLGVAGTLMLLAWPYFASRRRDGLIQFAMSIVYPLIGVVVWVKSFLLSDMVLMCRLF